MNIMDLLAIFYININKYTYLCIYNVIINLILYTSDKLAYLPTKIIVVRDNKDLVRTYIHTYIRIM